MRNHESYLLGTIFDISISKALRGWISKINSAFEIHTLYDKSASPWHGPVPSPRVAGSVKVTQSHQDERYKAPCDSHQPTHSNPSSRPAFGHESRIPEAFGDVDVSVHRQYHKAEVGQIAPKHPKTHAQLAVGYPLVPWEMWWWFIYVNVYLLIVVRMQTLFLCKFGARES